jgi:hypothetical protein
MELLISQSKISTKSKALALTIHISMLLTSTELSAYVMRFYNGHYGLFDNLF